nr:molybdopterin-dependent oxidoreductase [uncultured Desulfobacter sp.]
MRASDKTCGNIKDKTKPQGVSRRDLIKASGAAALGILCSSAAGAAEPDRQNPRELQGAAETVLSEGVKTVYSVCLACNARCGIRGVVKDGRLVNVSGNPYHPYNMQFSPIDYDTDIKEALTAHSPICGKALDTPQHITSPYRLKRPLKRSGPRGSGKFEPIAWETLIREIGEGGRLFSHLGENRVVPGVKETLSDEPIDPTDSYLGSRCNGLVFITGRLQSGRKEFIDRFVKSSVGSKNRVGHTDICGLGFRMGNYALSDGAQVELKADPKSADYILVFGANIYEALQPGINTYGAIVSRRQADDALSFSVVDPRATRAAVHADDWLPVKPGKDGALAMGIIRWMMENKKVNEAYLSLSNPKSVKEKGYGVVSNASHLVICDSTHSDDGAFLRMKHIDPALGESAAGDFDPKDKMVFLKGEDTPRPAQTVAAADLDRTGVVTDYFGNKIKVKTAYTLLRESAMAYSLEDYATACGVSEKQIAAVAKEFSSHGSRAAVTQYHGAGNYVNGTYAAYAIAALNVLVGSVNMKGGYLNGGGGCGKPLAGFYDLKSFPGRKENGGVGISREKAHYEKTVEYTDKKARTGSGYPAKRPWFAFSKGGLSVEALSGIDQQYPYPAKVLFTYLYNPVFSIPGGYRYKETLKDPDKVPLHVSMDIAVNESNIFADYIIPDLSFAEGHYGWLTPHAPGMNFTGIRSPMIEPMTEKTPDGRPICTETFLIDLAVSLNMPGFGKKAIADKSGGKHDFFCAEDFYLRAFANIAQGAGLAKATQAEVDYVESSYPLARYKSILAPDAWRQVCTMLARGGVFKPYDSVFDGEVFKKGLKEVHIYNERLARTFNSLSGERFGGVPKWIAPRDSKMTLMDDLEAHYPYTLVTYKNRLHTQSRSLWSSISMEIEGENRVEINTADAAALKLRDGDNVVLSSKSNPEGIRGKVAVTALIRQGCVGVSFHFGHTQFGATALDVADGQSVFMGGASVMAGNRLIPEPAFAAGLNPNDVALLDANLNDTPLVDLVGGIPDFSSTRIRIKKV